MKLKPLFFLLTLALLPSLTWADPQSELVSFSAFPQIDLNKLDQGETEQSRGNSMQFQRGIYSQSAFVLNAPIAQVQDRLLHWDTAKHKELKVFVHELLPVAPTTPTSFAGLKTLPDNRSTAYLVDYTTKIAPDFHEILVNSDEVKLWSTFAPRATDKESKRAAVLDYWSQVLSGRVNLFLSGQYAGNAGAYDTSDEGKIHVFTDIAGLIGADTKVAHQFHDLFAQTPFSGQGTPVPPAELYYECYDVQGQAALGTGAVYVNKVASSNSVQLMDVEYYENYGVYTVIELEQLWPVTINGAEKTLVWRADLVSAPEVAELHGVERQASTMIMLQEVKQSIDVFRTEFK